MKLNENTTGITNNLLIENSCSKDVYLIRGLYTGNYGNVIRES